MKKFIKKLETPILVTTSAVMGLYFSNGIFSGMDKATSELKNDFQNFVLCKESKYVQYFNDDYGETFDSFLLRHRSIISIDLAQIHDLENLQFFKHLDKIEISNAQLLNDHWIDIINSCDIKEIYLKFDSRGIVRNINKKFDLGRFNDKSIIKDIVLQDCNTLTDYEGVLLLNYFENYSDLECLDLSKYKEIDDKLNKIIENIEFYDNDTNVDKLIRLAKYIHEHVEYDPLVSTIISYRRNISSLNSDEINYYEENKKLKNDKSRYYNEYPLEAVLGDIDQEEYGVCISFAKFYSSLAIKLGIPLQSVSGNGHAWNLYAEDGVCEIPCYIDMTALDNNEDLFSNIDDYLSSFSSYKYDEITKDMFISTYSLKAMNDYYLDGEISDYYQVVPDKDDRIFGSTYRMSYKGFILLSLLFELQMELLIEVYKIIKKDKELCKKIKSFFVEEIVVKDERYVKLDNVKALKR